MEVVLRWTATESRFGFEEVDDISEKDLNNIEDEECESKALDHGRSEH